jgi:hypothetical protein
VSDQLHRSELSMNVFWDLWFNLAGYRLGEYLRYRSEMKGKQID